ncbi:hypothetical protein Q8A67_006118 [Cirrhinus molitorella]|uniref:Uncharacterized protein n=1 Tax=Cirrhinus molitorella TaxID=172907 RepID=A0AA88TT82_9TELE|nr:hypothetical protein Q8A67_006118 [Cirrhinus molitorella]
MDRGILGGLECVETTGMPAALADINGVYYCMNTRTPPKLSNSTRLHLTESVQLTECHNHTVEEFIDQNSMGVNCIDQNQTQWRSITIAAALMNGLLLIVLIGLLNVFVGNRRSAEHSQLSADLQQTQVTKQPQDKLHLKKCESTLITKIV